MTEGKIVETLQSLRNELQEVSRTLVRLLPRDEADERQARIDGAFALFRRLLAGFLALGLVVALLATGGFLRAQWLCDRQNDHRNASRSLLVDAQRLSARPNPSGASVQEQADLDRRAREAREFFARNLRLVEPIDCGVLKHLWSDAGQIVGITALGAGAITLVVVVTSPCRRRCFRRACRAPVGCLRWLWSRVRRRSRQGT